MDAVTALLTAAKTASRSLPLLDDAARQAVLHDLAKALRAAKPQILAENAKDCAAMKPDDPWHDRLLLTDKRLDAIAADVEKLAAMPSPLSGIQQEKTLPNGLKLQRVPVPLGVVGVIYESRPNVTVDVFALCFKSGNAAVLRGGKEAHHSNAALAAVIVQVLAAHNIDPAACTLLPPEREATGILLNAVGLVDVCIPRGSQGLIDFVRDNAKIPVIETGAGIVHVYFDAAGDIAKGRDIIFNSKTRRVSVCNALDTLVVHEKRLADLPGLAEKLAEKDVEIFADAAAYAVLTGKYPEALLKTATEEDFGREFLSYKMSVKTVPSLDAALAHIAQYSSGHSEAVVTEDTDVSARFMASVDAAAVYHNAATSFTDGGEFGMGAEIGISTQKLHARGPMALEALTSYKWLVYGNGQTRT
ncbi:MAG: glutamate-5-semialdehyde dehydrogenase [Micavibrio sp.]|nr:glutamate-5-semialdehyde dehydrogenase [Micavibrio sp.]